MINGTTPLPSSPEQSESYFSHPIRATYCIPCLNVQIARQPRGKPSSQSLSQEMLRCTPLWTSGLLRRRSPQSTPRRSVTSSDLSARTSLDKGELVLRMIHACKHMVVCTRCVGFCVIVRECGCIESISRCATIMVFADGVDFAV
jgi:hypothetical protein